MHSSLEPFLEKLKRGEPVKAVMFGTSITFGSQVDPDFDPDVTYHSQWLSTVKEQYPQAHLSIVNKGVPGNKIAHAIERVESDVIAERPDLVVVEFGINDCWDGPDKLPAFEDGLRRLAGELREQLDAPVILLTANMLNHDAPAYALDLAAFAEQTAHAQNNGWTLEYMNAVRRVARDLDLPLADGYAKWERERAHGMDTDALLINRANHPTFVGHALLTEALQDVFASESR